MTAKLPMVPDSASGAPFVAQVLRLEALAVQVMAALSARGLPALLIKGPVTNRWLHGDALSRLFRDIDILVAPESVADAEAVLRELGLRNLHAEVLGIHRPDYESTWTSAFGAVDLHTRLAGIPAARADDAWRQLWEHAIAFSLHGNEVQSFSLAARTMLLGLHAARSDDDVRPLHDLEVGLDGLPPMLWREAAELATSLGAGSCFALGLRRSGPGRDLLRDIGYEATPTLESLLLERGAAQETLVVAATLESSRWITPSVLRRWFSTEHGRPSARMLAAAVVRLPGACWTVFRLRRRLRRSAAAQVRDAPPE